MNARTLTRTCSLALLGLLVASRSASPQVLKGSQALINVKLGLWEVTTAAQMSGTPPIDTSRMTPEQQKKMEAAMAMAKQHAAAPHTTKSCLTKEKMEKEFLQESKADCTSTVITNSPKVYEVKVDCRGEHPSTGQWKFEALSPESIKGSGTFTMEGNKMSTTASMTGKWIAGSCGDVK